MTATAEPELALLNANWRTGPTFARLHHGTLVIGDGRILAAGGTPDAARLAERSAKTIDVDGALVVPGFVDSHTHLGWAGQGLFRVDWSHARNRADALAELQRAVARIESGLWLLGGGWSGGWSRAVLLDAELPSLAELDAATGDVPLFLTSADGSLAVCNSRGIKLLCLTNGLDSALRPGGDVELDADGRLTGRLFGVAAHARATAGVVPPPDRSRRRAELRAAVYELARHGVTEAHDIATLPDDSPTPLTHRERSFTDATLFDELAERGELTARISIRPHLDRWAEAAQWRTERQGGSVTCAGVKLLLDRELYSPAGTGGGYAYRYPGFRTALEWTTEAHSAGLNVTLHAVGDLAVQEALDLLEQATAPDRGAPQPRRHRISHARRIAPVDIPRFARLGVIAELQPWDLAEQMPLMLGRFDHEFLETAYPFAALLEAGARIALSSDWRLDQRADLRDLDPLMAIHVAVTRTAPNQPAADAWQPAQRIGVGEALAGYTRCGAWAAEAEHVGGAIDIGRRADLTVLSRDVVADGPDALANTRVLLTAHAGRIVYTA